MPSIGERANRVWSDITSGQTAKGIEPQNTTYLRELIEQAAKDGGTVDWADVSERSRTTLILRFHGPNFDHSATTTTKRGEKVGGRELIGGMETMAFAVLARANKRRRRSEPPYDHHAELGKLAAKHGFKLVWEGLGVMEPPKLIGAHEWHEKRTIYRVRLSMVRPDLTWPFAESGAEEELEAVVLRIVNRALIPLWGLSGLARLASEKPAAIELVKDVPRGTGLREAAE